MWVAAERPPRTRAARLFVFSRTCVIISKPVTPCKTFRGNMAEFFNRLLGTAHRRAGGSGMQGEIAWIQFKLYHYVSRHRSLAKRQMHRKLRSLLRRALDFHFAVVGLDDGFDQTKAEAESLLRAALVAAIEPLPNPGYF